MLLYNGTVHSLSEKGTIPQGFVLMEEGKIKAIGEMKDCPQNDIGEKMDVQGGHIFPGFVDAHCHLGVFGDALGFEADDGNESTDPCTPHLRAIDAINPLDRCFQEARQNGVSTVATGPGSANAISGQFVAIKTQGSWVDKMILQSPIAMKFAMGENPKSVYHGRDETPITRMAIASIQRENLALAQEYLNKINKATEDEEEDRPDFDAKLEALLPVLRGELPIHIHAHRADDIFTGIRVAEEFSLKYVIVHGTEGHLIADSLGELGASVITGPNLGDRSKPELKNLSIHNTHILHKAGVKVAICTDHPVIPIQYLPLCASLAVKGGLSPEEALRAITITPAEILGIDSRVGSLAEGKDADVVVSTKDPLDFMGEIKAVFVNGVLVKD
ncbi:MAG: amidohydrolase [Eubacteriales bacterium]